MAVFDFAVLAHVFLSGTLGFWSAYFNANKSPVNTPQIYKEAEDASDIVKNIPNAPEAGAKPAGRFHFSVR